ncbi:MAG: hypothetical protein A2275_13610 [Bacteroidetes bacterium RIFOXYA12_FULL_35_11]|nr:MAG: hypothetical protein A2X01_20245 [Bacteroidetes bacterium GWF2_35_48]OFY82553.1 MAG: hypothetical protein A2275_13610 [Bacteroidetes bacterium RIFOXYA12_FULL_35_11]OFY93179.1 MAG: hypothetical protein A2309_02035 [Bacteroidetes bacterium RIFOXYB2_FULL_35_7]HBX52832.1 hypothetical protein [Bacteroidales bacterium]
MKKLLLLFFSGFTFISQAQLVDTLPNVYRIDGEHGNMWAYLITMMQQSGRDSIPHVDSTYTYSLIIPKWYTVRETNEKNILGGTFPALNNIQSALIFKSFLRKFEIRSFEDFENWVILETQMGKHPTWSNTHIILEKNEDDLFSDIGKAYRVKMERLGFFYRCEYILVETSKSYVWIDFTSPDESFDEDLLKLKEILKTFKKF